LKSLALYTWGWRHRSLAAERFAELLADAVQLRKSGYPEEVWLLTEPASAMAVGDVLSRAGVAVRIESGESGELHDGRFERGGR
jgi:hypothetical protein